MPACLPAIVEKAATIAVVALEIVKVTYTWRLHFAYEK